MSTHDEPLPVPLGEPGDPLFSLSVAGVEFTPGGIARYKQRFAWAGFDINDIRSLDQLEEALEASWPFEQTHLCDWLSEKTSGDPLERRALLAVMRGEPSEVEAALALLKARRSAAGTS